jgi:hypothetical protein
MTGEPSSFFSLAGKEETRSKSESDHSFFFPSMNGKKRGSHFLSPSHVDLNPTQPPPPEKDQLLHAPPPPGLAARALIFVFFFFFFEQGNRRDPNEVCRAEAAAGFYCKCRRRRFVGVAVSTDAAAT